MAIKFFWISCCKKYTLTHVNSIFNFFRISCCEKMLAHVNGILNFSRISCCKKYMLIHVNGVHVSPNKEVQFTRKQHYKRHI